MKTKSKRIFYFDALRFLAIFSVIVFHVFLRMNGVVVGEYVVSSLNWWITDFMGIVMRCGVAIFLMLSGALSLGRQWDIKSFLGKRLPRITLPFVFWVLTLSTILILLMYFNLLPKFNYISSFTLSNILSFYYGAFLDETVWFIPYWFFWMILGTYLIMPIFNKWLCNCSMGEVEYFLVIWAITCLFDRTLFIHFPIALSYFTGPIGMVILGYYLRYTDRKIFNNVYYGFFFLIIASVLLMAISYLLSDPTSFYTFDRYSILYVIEVIGFFCVFKNFGQLNLNFKFLTDPESAFKKFVMSIAKYSYGIYLIHMIFVNLFVIFLSNALNYKGSVILIPILSLIVSWVILMILNRVPYLNKVIGAK